MRSYTAASFFSGCGVMDYAAFAGFSGRLDIRHLCEISPFKRSLLRKHATAYWAEDYQGGMNDV